MQSEYPYVSKLVQLASKAQKEGRLRDDMDPRMIIGGWIALVFGMLIFDQYIRQSTGLIEDQANDMFKRIVSSWGALFVAGEENEKKKGPA